VSTAGGVRPDQLPVDDGSTVRLKCTCIPASIHGLSLNEHDPSLLVVGSETLDDGLITPPHPATPIRLLSVWRFSPKISAGITDIPVTSAGKLLSVTVSAHNRGALAERRFARPAHLRPSLAAAHAGRLFRDDIRARTGSLVPDLDQDPALRAGTRQREATRQFAAVQDEGDVTGLVADDLGGSLIPDDHRAGPAALTLVDALELAGRQGMILDRDRQPPDARIKRGSLGHRP